MFQSIFRPNLFENQRFIVTGGGTGIGRTIAHELASLGAHVILASRRADVLRETQDEIIAVGGSCSYVACNIRQQEEVVALFEQVVDTHGRVDGVVNNGGGQFPSKAEDISRKGWNAVVDTNMTGTFFMCQEAFKQSMKQHGGSIVNIVAEMWRGFPGMVHTGAARAGVVNLTKTLAVEWANYGIRVNSVAPGVIDGNGIRQYGEAAQMFIEMAQQDQPYFRLGTESEISAAVVFLLSPAAAFISGETLKVDGASSLWRKPWDIQPHSSAPKPFDGFTKSE